jgi:hypothetical protein
MSQRRVILIYVPLFSCQYVSVAMLPVDAGSMDDGRWWRSEEEKEEEE